MARYGNNSNCHCNYADNGLELTMVAIISLPFFAISVKYFFGKLRDLTRKRSQALASVQSYLHERVSGISIIKSFALEEHEQQIFDKENGEFLDRSLDHTKWNAKSFAVVNTITDIAPLTCYWIGRL